MAARGAVYGLPGIEVDGNDVLAVSEAAAEAVATSARGRRRDLDRVQDLSHPAARRRHGRLHLPHPRGRRAVEDALPDRAAAAPLVDEGIATRAELKAIDDDVESQALEAIAFAEKSAWPDPATAADHVYATPPTGDGRIPIRNEAGRAEGQHVRETTFMKATLEALSEAMERNPRIFVMGEGIGKRGGNFATTTGLFDRYGPVRLCDTPISERGFVGLAAGAAMTGTRPVIDFMFADFILDSVGEIINQIAKIQYMSSGRLKMPVLLRGCIGIGNSAATHHSGNYYPMYAHFPGLRVVVPSTPFDAKGLFWRAPALRRSGAFPGTSRRPLHQGPSAGRALRDRVRTGGGRREGSDVTVVALALMVHHVLKASELLAREGISVELIDPRTVAPLDVETIQASVAQDGTPAHRRRDVRAVWPGCRDRRPGRGCGLR